MGTEDSFLGYSFQIKRIPNDQFDYLGFLFWYKIFCKFIRLNVGIMSLDKENKKKNKVEEPKVEYEVQKRKFKGIDRETFDFDAEFAKGLTPEEAKAESIRKIREWWGK